MKQHEDVHPSGKKWRAPARQLDQQASIALKNAGGHGSDMTTSNIDISNLSPEELGAIQQFIENIVSYTVYAGSVFDKTEAEHCLSVNVSTEVEKLRKTFGIESWTG
jgi:hypothetical protein